MAWAMGMEMATARLGTMLALAVTAVSYTHLDVYKRQTQVSLL